MLTNQYQLFELHPSLEKYPNPHVIFCTYGLHLGKKGCLEFASLNRIHLAISKKSETAVGFCDLPALSLSRICNWFCGS